MRRFSGGTQGTYFDPDELASLDLDTQRRRILRCLARADQGLHLADLARDVAKLEMGVPGGGASDVESVYVRLYHRHVPRLQEAGLVSFDADSKTATVTATARAALSSIEPSQSESADERPSSH